MRALQEQRGSSFSSEATWLTHFVTETCCGGLVVPDTTEAYTHTGRGA